MNPEFIIYTEIVFQPILYLNSLLSGLETQ